MNIVALSQTILREQGRRVLHMVASAVFEGAVFEGAAASAGQHRTLTRCGASGRLRKNSNGRTVGALCERAFLVESTNYARSQTAPTVKSVPLSRKLRPERRKL